jgi:hypothetical protein
MNRRNRTLTKKLVALVIIVALLQVVGVSPGIIIFLVGAGLFVSYIAKRAEHKETQRVFAFYIAADEILRNEQREWYGFEIAEVIGDAERVMNSMPDPPTLCYFVVGALCHQARDYSGAVEYLNPLLDTEWLETRRLAAPSPQLRRYVDLLRDLERDPSIAPQALCAVRNLERLRQKQLIQLTMESREQLKNSARGETPLEGFSFATARAENGDAPVQLHSVVPPPSIADVLHDVYADEKQTPNS